MYMPLIFNLRLIVITALLFAEHYADLAPQYVILALQTGFVLFVLVGRPHKRNVDIVRAICI